MVSDLGGASISLYAILVSVVISGTSLYREVEQKTIFPILTRPIGRGEYLVGKYLGTLLTLLVFIAFDAGACLLIVSGMAGRSPLLLLAVVTSTVVALGVGAWKLPRWATLFPVPIALGLATVGAFLAANAPDERRVVLGMAVLALLEVGIVAAFATLFASFTSPFLSVVFTLGIWIVGRSADTLAKMPDKTFGAAMKRAAAVLAHLVPNLQVYVPARPLLTGETAAGSLSTHVALASAQTACWAVGLLAISSVIFRRRDFL